MRGEVQRWEKKTKRGGQGRSKGKRRREDKRHGLEEASKKRV